MLQHVFLNAKKGPSQIFGALKCPPLCLENWKAALCSLTMTSLFILRLESFPFLFYCFKVQMIMSLYSSCSGTNAPCCLGNRPVAWIRQWRHLAVRLYIVALTPVAERVWECECWLWLCSEQSCSSSEQCIASPTNSSRLHSRNGMQLCIINPLLNIV